MLLEGYGWVLDIEKGLLDIDGAMLDIEGAMLDIEEGVLDIAAEGLEEKDDEEGISTGKLDELNIPDGGWILDTGWLLDTVWILDMGWLPDAGWILKGSLLSWSGVKLVMISPKKIS